MKGTKTKVGRSSGSTKWRLRVFIGRDENGKQLFDGKTYVGSSAEADAELAAMVRRVEYPGRSKRVEHASKRTFAAAVELWREKDAPKLSPSSLRGYESVLAKHVLPELGDALVSRMQPRTIYVLREKILAAGAAPATANRVHATISAVLRRAVDEGWIPRNPAREVKRATEAWRPPTAPKGDELGKLLLALDDEDERAIVLLAIATGARRGELCALRWSDLDLDGGRVTIARSIVVDSEAKLVEKDTKTHSARSNVLPQYALDVLAERRARADAWAERCAVTVAPDGFVFSDDPRSAVPWRPDLVTHRWIRARTRAGLGSVRFHDLRHYAASAAFRDGADAVTVRDRLGHRSISTTNLYAHSHEEADAELARLQNERLGPLFARD